MNNRTLSWWFIFFVFIVAAVATVYFTFQLRRNTPTPSTNYLAADKGYGVTIDLIKYDDPDLTGTLAEMHRHGLTWLRQPISWADVEPEMGQFNWQEVDRIFAAVAQTNLDLQSENSQRDTRLKIIVVLQSPPAWARPSNSSPTAPPTQSSDFGNFARAFAARYGQQIDYYQIWHEPNLSAGWGDTFVDAAAYADMLREAAFNIRAADSHSYILTAALAATAEDNPLNVNELNFLDQLYRAKANQWFDIVAIQPLGLWTKPLNTPSADQVNFRRAELVRQIMLNHNDAGTPLWATAFGWVVLPSDWNGQPSPWSYDTAAVQAPRTATAIQYARQNWPWLGPMLAVRWDTTGLDADDPARGFALTETPSMLQVITEATAETSIATVGRYPAYHPSGVYSGNWRFATTRADIPRQGSATLTIPFEGTRLDLEIERGPFRGYLWVTVDDQPANALPQNGQGQSYVVLYDPLRRPDAVTLAQNLPPGRHEAVINADGGWGQWALLGWHVSNQADTRFFYTGLLIAGLVAVAGGLGLLGRLLFHPLQAIKPIWAWSEILIALYAVFGEWGQIAITLILALGVYVGQGLIGFALLLLLALAILLRPDLGLMLIAVAIFFFQIPVQLPVGNFSPVELLLALTLIGLIFRTAISTARTIFTTDEPASQSPILNPSTSLPSTSFRTGLQSLISNLQSLIPNLKSTDLAALALVILALLATLIADNFAVSIREWRTVVVESIIFYFLVRLGLDYHPQITNPKPVLSEVEVSKIINPKSGWVSRLINAFVAGATLQAILALYLYFFTDRSIDAEGVHRALGLGYGSPNNLALVLDRAWPILLAMTLLPGYSRLRRSLYGVGLLATSLALYLTFSKGALLLGLPAAAVVMTFLYGLHRWPQRRGRIMAALVGVGAVLALALVPFSRTARFRNTFSVGEGSTAFFRVKLWQASWSMLQDHWPLGVGLDNFLYQYRTRYILPEAWQEPDLNHPHNLILDFGTRLGVGGIAILVWLQIAFWRNAWRLYKRQFDPLLLGLIGSMVVFLSHGLVDNSYFLVDLAFAFFLVVGIVQALVDKMQESPKMEE